MLPNNGIRKQPEWKQWKLCARDDDMECNTSDFLDSGEDDMGVKTVVG